MDDNYRGLVVFLGANDMEATDRFYSGLLGLSLFKDQGVCRIYDVPGGGRLGFCTHVPVVQAEKSPIITLLHDDVDAMYAQLTQAGFTPAQQPAENPRFNIYHFFVTDPNGYWVEVQKFLD